MGLSDLMLEREKLKGQLNKWKWLFILLLLILIFTISKSSSRNSLKEPYIARISIEGPISYDQRIISKIKELGDDKNLKAVILNIDSPGSTTFAGEELFVALRKLNQKKPLVAVIKTMAASGGYMIALASDHIIARNMSLTGSIGVLWQSFEAVDMAKKLGINFVSVKSSPLKASPNPMEEATTEAKEVVLENIEDNFKVFLEIFISSRKLQPGQAVKLADGRVYSGLRAKELGMIDEIGGEDEALNWLEQVQNISKDTKIEDISLDVEESMYSEILKFIGGANKILSSDLFKNLLNYNAAGQAMLR